MRSFWLATALPVPVMLRERIPSTTSAIYLAWNRAVAGGAITAYEVSRNGVVIASGVVAPSYDDETVSQGQTYTYRVRGMGPGVVSDWSAPLSASAAEDNDSIPFGADEPRYVGAGQTLGYSQNFSSIAPNSQAAMTAAGLPFTSDVPGGYFYVNDNAGFVGTRTGVGGRAARNHWEPPAVFGNEQRQLVEWNGFGAGTGASREWIYHQHYYRAPNFNFGTGTSPHLGKKHYLLIIYGGTNSNPSDGESWAGRVTLNMPGLSLPWVRAAPVGGDPHDPALKLDHPFIGADWPEWNGSEGANAYSNRYIGNGNWHRVTLGRLPESAPGSADGAVRTWFDAFLVYDVQNFATGTGNFHTVQFASTFNGGSLQTQDEYFDDVTIWAGSNGVS